MKRRGGRVAGRRRLRNWGDPMNILLRCGLVTMLVATAGWASDEKKTDAQRYGLAGPIRTMSTQEGKAEFSLDQTDWPVLVGMVECKECEFDREGALTR